MKFSKWTVTTTTAISWAMGLLSLSGTHALFADEAGVNDFVVTTSGHSHNKFVHVDAFHGAILTSDVGSSGGGTTGLGNQFPSSCTVASRSIATGHVNWRRMVCSTTPSSTQQQQHATSASSKYVCTIDHQGIVRAWTLQEGALVWEVDSSSSSGKTSGTPPQIWTSEQLTAVSVSSSDSSTSTLLFLDTATGTVLNNTSPHKKFRKVSDITGHAKLKGSGWPSLLKLVSVNGKNYALVGYTATKESSSGSTISPTTQMDGSAMALVELVHNAEDHTISLGTTTTMPKNNSNNAGVFDMDQLEIVVQQPQEEEQQQQQLMVMASPELQWDLGIRMTLEQDTFPLPPYPMKTHTRSSSIHDTLVYCPAMNMAVALEPSPSEKQEGEYLIWAYQKMEKGGELVHQPLGEGITSIPLTPQDSIDSLVMLDCSVDSTSILVMTPTGTTHQITLTKKEDGKDVQATLAWTAEEGLATITSALLLDASHGHGGGATVVDALTQEEETAALQRLSLGSRLQHQISDFTSLWDSSSSSSDDKNHIFGFVKIAVLLSSTHHKVYGMETIAPHRGHIQWTRSLPSNALWHTMVHGTTSGVTAVDHHSTMASHGHEILLVSALPSSSSEDDSRMEIQWTCIDGTTGNIHASDTVTTSSPVVQVIPLYATSPTTSTSTSSSSSCRQMAMLLQQDNTVTMIPSGPQEEELTTTSTLNGLYTHIVEKKSPSSLESLQIQTSSSSSSGTNHKMQARLVGQTTFHGERIVKVAYPQREEVVQSPCAITGDDSLLLKYLNPHMAVIVTMAEEDTSISKEEDEEEDTFASVLNSASSSSSTSALKSMKKSSSSSSTSSDTPSSSDTTTTPEVAKDAPNLFVNVVDTVSGRVLYRASHANAQASTTNVPVVVNENWIMYSFFNEKTRRTELGVLSLYEGMIPKTGITAFQSAEQSEKFSSLDARDSKPVVMAKTYGIAKPITAMGVTSTKGGISARHMIVATGDDKIMSFDRRVMDPRRPVGDLREAEKTEGLKQYSPLLPLVSLMSPSHNRTIHNVQTIVSTSTALESQSLVLAFGGPDIFFVRMAPSKGFDLLPDSFNRILLSIVVLGLLTVLWVVKGMSSKKAVTMSWE